MPAILPFARMPPGALTPRSLLKAAGIQGRSSQLRPGRGEWWRTASEKLNDRALRCGPPRAAAGPEALLSQA